MTWISKPGSVRVAALVAVTAVVFLPAAWAVGQRGGGGRGQPHPSAQRSRPQSRTRNQERPEPPSQGGERGVQGRGQGNAGPRPYGPPSGLPGNGFRPGYPGPADGRPFFPGPPAPPYYNPRYAPPGHLEDWLNRHRDLPLREQEQLLRNDPTFKRLPSANQQRLMRQLQEVDRMSPQRRAWRLARAEAIEHLSPQARRQLDRSSLRFADLPQPRHALIKRAFQQLRSVHIFSSQDDQTAFQQALEIGRLGEVAYTEGQREVEIRLAEVVRLDYLGTTPTQFEVPLGSSKAKEERLPFEHIFHPEEHMPESPF